MSQRSQQHRYASSQERTTKLPDKSDVPILILVGTSWAHTQLKAAYKRLRDGLRDALGGNEAFEAFVTVEPGDGSKSFISVVIKEPVEDEVLQRPDDLAEKITIAGNRAVKGLSRLTYDAQNRIVRLV